jgi:hypothetical protein
MPDQERAIGRIYRIREEADKTLEDLVERANKARQEYKLALEELEVQKAFTRSLYEITSMSYEAVEQQTSKDGGWEIKVVTTTKVNDTAEDEVPREYPPSHGYHVGRADRT